MLPNLQEDWEHRKGLWHPLEASENHLCSLRGGLNQSKSLPLRIPSLLCV